MMPFIGQFLDVAPNWVILATYAVVTAAMSLAVSALVWRIFPRRVSSESSVLGDNSHVIILSFAIFILAIAIGEARQNLAVASDIVEQEAFQVGRLNRQLLRYGTEQTVGTRSDLAAYVKSIVEGGWSQMAAAHKGGTSTTRRILDRLADEIYGLEPANTLQQSLKPVLIESLDGIEKQRELRLEKSTNTVPTLFWAVIFILVVISMALCGRYHRTRPALFFIAAHMAVIGVGMALLAILDVPFRGETSVSPQPLIDAVGQIARSLSHWSRCDRAPRDGRRPTRLRGARSG